MLGAIEKHLELVWRLQIKDSSRHILVCKGGDTSCVPGNFQCSRSLNVLGHHVQYDAGARAEWRSMRGCLWGCFWKTQVIGWPAIKTCFMLLSCCPGVFMLASAGNLPAGHTKKA